MGKTATKQPTLLGTDVTVPMVMDKETKNAFRFRAVADNSPITTVYVAKSEFPTDGAGIVQAGQFEVTFKAV